MDSESAEFCHKFLGPFESRRKELSSLADDIESSDRPVRVKIIRLRHLRNEMDSLAKRLDAEIEKAVKEIKNGVFTLPQL
jgi:hypothetical protein